MKSAIYRIAKMFVLIWGMIASSASWAEEVSASSDAACQDSFEYMHQLARLDVSPYRAAYVDGWCEIRDLQIENNYSIDIARWKIVGWEQQDLRELPRELHLELAGIRFNIYGLVKELDDPVLKYIQRETVKDSPGASAVISFSRTGVATDRGLLVHEAGIFYGEDNSISLNGQFRNVDISTFLGSTTAIAALIIDRANLVVTSHGGFEDFALTPLAYALLRTTDPDAEVAALKEKISNQVRAQEGFLGAGDQDALVRLIADMPHPKGQLRISMSPKNGFALFQLARIARADDLGDVLGEANLSFSYDQTK